MTSLLRRLAAGAASLMLGGGLIVAGGLLLGQAEAQTTAPATTAPATTNPAAAPKPDTVIAIVDGRKLTRTDVIASAATLPAEYRSQIDSYWPQLIDRLIDITLMSEEGRRQKLQDDPEVKKLVADYEDQAIRAVLVRRFLADKVGDDQLKKHYDEMMKAVPPAVELHASHILLTSEADAKAVIKELDAGGDFAKLAKAKSKDTQSGAQGGDLNWFGEGDMVPEFWAAAVKLQKGKYTEQPVESQYGWHVILLVDERTKPQPTFDQIKDQVRSDLSQEVITAWLKDMHKAAKIQKFNPDGSPIATP